MENNKLHILVVDDDDRIRTLLKDYLSENNYIISTAENADQAKIKLGHLKFDIIILDVMMPGQNGYDLTRDIKKNSKIPIILLTAKGEVENRIKGLELGADDYLGKPFEPKELLLRIQNILKRFNKDIKTSEKQQSTKFGPFLFNQKSLNLYRNNEPVHLTTAEQKLLNCFCKSPNTAFSRDDINNSLGGNMEARSIDVAIARIRRKIEIDQRYPIYLQTIRGIGWMLQTHEEENED